MAAARAAAARSTAGSPATGRGGPRGGLPAGTQPPGSPAQLPVTSTPQSPSTPGPQEHDATGSGGTLADAVLRPVREGNAFESTVEHLATAIRLGVFAEGERLPPERELAERLKVGRATLRDAIGALRQAGLVTTRRGRGGGSVVVYRGPRVEGTGVQGLDWTREQIADALAFRRVVEPGAAALAAGAGLSAEQRSWLVEALRAVTAAGDEGRRVADARLHLAIASLSGSARVVDAVTQAQSCIAELLAAIPVLQVNIAHSDSQHAEIVEAVLAGDADRARTVMEEHCDATSALLRGLIA
ncbi:MAG TPA: GntR family transcriptional regulator [Kineosporiaceae bacterium]|nr:GntR family transcriptional regulator [Kineosporiaceae bacterium]